MNEWSAIKRKYAADMHLLLGRTGCSKVSTRFGWEVNCIYGLYLVGHPVGPFFRDTFVRSTDADADAGMWGIFWEVRSSRLHLQGQFLLDKAVDLTSEMHCTWATLICSIVFPHQAPQRITRLDCCDISLSLIRLVLLLDAKKLSITRSDVQNERDVAK